ncbi:MAG: BrnT family toxin [Thiomicrospira sp.]
MIFEWDEQKNQSNIAKHGIDFEEAQEVFSDPLHISLLDKRFSYFEERWFTLGATKNRKILVVANLFFTDEGEEVIRIISAREANNKEKTTYENT